MSDGRVHKVSAAGVDHDVIYSIDCHEGNIWLGRKRGGLTRLYLQDGIFRERTWTRKDGLPQDSIFAVRALADGSVWAAGLTGGAGHLVHGHLKTYDARQLGSGAVSAIEQTTDGTVWFATSNGLVSFQSGFWQRFGGGNLLPSQEILSLTAERNGLFVGTSLGLAYVDGQGHRAVQTFAALPKDPVLGIALDGHGGVWVSTTDRVLSLPDAAPGSRSAISAH